MMHAGLWRRLLMSLFGSWIAISAEVRTFMNPDAGSTRDAMLGYMAPCGLCQPPSPMIRSASLGPQVFGS